MSTALVHAPTRANSTPAYNHFDELRRAVLNGVVAEASRRNYALPLDERSLFCKIREQSLSRTLIQEFRTTMLDLKLSASTINVKLGAIRKLVAEARRSGVIDGEEALQMSDIPNVRQSGTRLGHWLTKV